MTAVTEPRNAGVWQDLRPGYPPPGANPGQVVHYLHELYAQCEPDALARYKRAVRNLLFADGRQWIDWNLREKAWRDTPEADGIVRVTMNYIRPILRARAQRLLQSELSWRVAPNSQNHEEQDRAIIGTNLLQARWRLQQMDDRALETLWMAFCTGVVYWKQFWNKLIGPPTLATMILPHPTSGQPTEYPVNRQGQPLMDDQGNPLPGEQEGYYYRPGDVDTATRSIFNVRLNPGATGLTAAEGFRWLMDAEVIPIHVVKERYGERARKVQTVPEIGVLKQYQSIVQSISFRSGFQSPGSDLIAGRGASKMPDKDETLLLEYWEAPVPEYLPEGRLVTIAGQELLYDGPLPQGFVPYVSVYDERRPFDPYGRPCVDDLVAPQTTINRQWSYILSELGLSGIGQWAMFDVPGLSDQVTTMPGAHIKVPLQSAVSGRGIGDVIQRVQPAHVSSDRWRLIDAALRVIFDIGAFHEIQRGQVPPGIESGVAIQALQEAENGQLHMAVRSLKNSHLQWAEQILRMARWGYGADESRWVPVDRPDLAYLVRSVKGADLPDPDSCTIDLEGFRPHSRTALAAEVKEAMAQGWIDPRTGLKLLDVGRGVDSAFDSQNRHWQRARRENLDIELGQFVLNKKLEPDSFHAQMGLPHGLMHLDGAPFALPQDDDHLIHIDVAQEIALDDSKPWPMRQIALFHILEHRLMWQAQMPPQQAGEPGDTDEPGDKAEPGDTKGETD